MATGANAPGEENALHHVEVLHQHVPLRFGAQVADGVADAQLDGPLQGRGGGLEAERREASRQRRNPDRQSQPGGVETRVPSCRWSLQRHLPSCGQSSSLGPGPLLTETASDQTETERLSLLRTDLDRTCRPCSVSPLLAEPSWLDLQTETTNEKRTDLLIRTWGTARF